MPGEGQDNDGFEQNPTPPSQKELDEDMKENTDTSEEDKNTGGS